MSFLQSNLDPNNSYYSAVLSGSNGVVGSYITGLFYTINSGQTWIQSNINSGNFEKVFLSGSNGVASRVGGQMYYTSDSGKNWLSSTDISFGVNDITLSGLNGLAGCSSSAGIYYTTNGGQTWIRSIDKSTNLQLNGSFQRVALSGSYGIAGSYSDLGIYYTIDSGKEWRQSPSVTTGYIYSVYLNGLIGLAGGNNTIYYTTNGGESWLSSTINPSLPSGTVFPTVILSGQKGIAGSFSNNGGSGLYYTIDSGVIWTQSNVTSGNFNTGVLSDLIGVTGSGNNSTSNLGIWTTKNGGQTWFQSNITTGRFTSASIDPASKKAIVSGNTNNGVFYSSGPVCFEKNTLILVLEYDEEVYKKVCELNVGDFVKTYRHGYKKIKIIKSFTYNFGNITRLKNSLYKMKGHDIIITGRHGILVDKITDEEEENVKNCGTELRYIEDKIVLPACASDKFERIISDEEFELWHFALENNDINEVFGVYINDGILSESCSEAVITNQ